MTLSDLQNGGRVIVLSCSSRQLCELGITTGTIIRMIKLGNPCIVCIGNTKLGLGKKYQTMIEIRRS